MLCPWQRWQTLNRYLLDSILSSIVELSCGNQISISQHIRHGRFQRNWHDLNILAMQSNLALSLVRHDSIRRQSDILDSCNTESTEYTYWSFFFDGGAGSHNYNWAIALEMLQRMSNNLAHFFDNKLYISAESQSIANRNKFLCNKSKQSIFLKRQWGNDQRVLKIVCLQAMKHTVESDSLRSEAVSLAKELAKNPSNAEISRLRPLLAHLEIA